MFRSTDVQRAADMRAGAAETEEARDRRVLEAIERSLECEQKVAGFISVDHLPKFEFLRPGTLGEAIAILDHYGERAALKAGGTDLLRELKNRSRLVSPEVVVSLKSVRPSLDYVVERGSGVAIGALVSLQTLATSPLLRERYGVLAEAAYANRSWQYRCAATIGGDLCQRELCLYSRFSGNAYACFRKGDETCFAVKGDNRCHAIFGRVICSAVCASETAPALAALGATVKLDGPSGERIVPVEDFFTARGTALKPSEILSEVQIPAAAPQSRGVFMKVGIRNKFDPALVSVAAVGSVGDGVCRSIRIVLGGVSAQPWRAFGAEASILGETLSEATAARAGQAATEGAIPVSGNGYKVDLVRALVKRALLGLTS